MSVRQLSINKRPKDGRSWVFYKNSYGLDGKRHQYSSKAFMTREEAELAEMKYSAKYKDIEINPHITFYEAYCKLYEYNKDKIRVTTLKTYDDRIRFMKLLNNVELVNLDGELYQKWRNKMNETNLSDRYKTDIQKLIKQVCNFAEKQWDFNLRKFYNKLVPFKTPGAIPKEMNYFKPEEFYQFISVVNDLQMRCLYKTLYYCGLRRGEARGLIWKNTDLENRKIYIKQQVQNNPKTNNDHDYYVAACKTPTSHRTIPIPDDLYNDLYELRKELKKYKMFKESWYTFGDKEPIGTHKMENWKDRYCEKAGVKRIRLHDFRHSCASALINGNNAPTTVAAYLGHSEPTETLETYSHMFEENLSAVPTYFNKIYEDYNQKNDQK